MQCGERGHSPSQTHTFMVWAESGKSAEEGGGARLVGEVGGLWAHWAGVEWRRLGEGGGECEHKGIHKTKQNDSKATQVVWGDRQLQEDGPICICIGAYCSLRTQEIESKLGKRTERQKSIHLRIVLFLFRYGFPGSMEHKSKPRGSIYVIKVFI